jgi:TrmH family RNA methyltransferase
LSAAKWDLDYVRGLRERRGRDQSGRCFVEGVRFVANAEDHGHEIEALVVARSMLKSAVGQMIARRLGKRIPVIEIESEQFRALSLLSEPQGIGAILRQRWRAPSQLTDPKRDALWLALSEVRSPGNLGSLLRTGDAVGMSGLICLSPSVDPFDPSTIRATMGSLLSVDFCRLSASELRALNRNGDYFVVGAAPDGERDYRTISYRRPIILMLGGERKGLSEEQRRSCDALVRIPMRGRCDSLNLAVAGSLLLYEAFGQRHPARR